MRRLNLLSLAVKRAEGATSHGMAMASRSWERQEKGFSPEPRKAHSPVDTLMSVQ